MRNEKGFTLAEIIGVIVVLAAIFAITAPTLIGVLDRSKENAYNVQKETIIKSAKSYVAEKGNTNEQLQAGAIISLTLNELNTLAYIELPIKNPLTDRNFDSSLIKVYIAKESNGLYRYCFYDPDNTDNQCTEFLGTATSRSTVLDKAKTLVYNGETCKTDGTTYNYMNGCYIKGNPSNNYVWFNGFLWRIMGINEDKTVKLIAQENITAISYAAANPGENWETSYAKKWLNEYFLSNLNQQLNSKIVAKTWCSDTTTDETSTRVTCTAGKETNSSKVGLLTLDEYNLAGGTNSYLKIGQYSWTMTPFSAAYAWYVYNGGSANGNGDVTSANGVLPVINVSSDTTITSGNGTLGLVDGKHDYYVMGEEKSNITNTSLVNKVTSGDYVKFANKTYRVVSKNATEVKLKLDGYYEEVAGTAYTMKYGADNVFTIVNRNASDATLQGIGYKLNTDVLNLLVPTSDTSNRNKLVTNKEWYRGAYANGNDYSLTSLKEDSTTKVTEDITVGLIRTGEMLSGQSASILTKNYTVASDYTNTKPYWGFTPYTSASASWYVYSGGDANDIGVTNASGVLPVIKVKSNTTITGGNGTLATPYEI